MSTPRGENTDDSMLSWLGDGLDSLMFGKHSRAYTWFVRGIVAAFVVLALVSLFTNTSPMIDVLTGIVFALFVLTAVVQIVALARRLQRSQETIDQSADALEATADEVAKAADQVEALSEEVSKGGDPETVERTAGDVRKRAEHAKGTADAVKEQMDGTRDEATQAKRDERDERTEQ